MAADIDGLTVNGRIHIRLDGRWTFEEFDEPTSWHWTGNLCSNMVPGHWGLVGSSQGEDEEENI